MQTILHKPSLDLVQSFPCSMTIHKVQSKASCPSRTACMQTILHRLSFDLAQFVPCSMTIRKVQSKASCPSRTACMQTILHKPHFDLQSHKICRVASGCDWQGGHSMQHPTSSVSLGTAAISHSCWLATSAQAWPACAEQAHAAEPCPCSRTYQGNTRPLTELRPARSGLAGGTPASCHLGDS